MRPLTADEVQQAAQDLAKLAEYQAWMGYMGDVYGPTAVEIRADLEGEYNDEGGTAYYVRNVAAVDANGEELAPDPSTPWMQQALADYEASAQETARKYPQYGPYTPLDLTDEDELSDFLSDRRGDLPHDDRYGEVCYRRDTPPALTFGALYVEA